MRLGDRDDIVRQPGSPTFIIEAQSNLPALGQIYMTGGILFDAISRPNEYLLSADKCMMLSRGKREVGMCSALDQEHALHCRRMYKCMIVSHMVKDGD